MRQQYGETCIGKANTVPLRRSGPRNGPRSRGCRIGCGCPIWCPGGVRFGDPPDSVVSGKAYAVVSRGSVVDRSTTLGVGQSRAKPQRPGGGRGTPFGAVLPAWWRLPNVVNVVCQWAASVEERRAAIPVIASVFGACFLHEPPGGCAAIRGGRQPRTQGRDLRPAPGVGGTPSH